MILAALACMIAKIDFVVPLALLIAAVFLWLALRRDKIAAVFYPDRLRF